MIKKRENCLNEKHVKITKRAHDHTGYASSYNVEILNSFNPELQLKHTESSIKNTLKALFTELKRFKLVATLVSGLKKIESDDKTKYNTFY